MLFNISVLWQISSNNVKEKKKKGTSLRVTNCYTSLRFTDYEMHLRIDILTFPS
jgi:hypothetical protein